MAIASYLKRTKERGNYSYRRMVPEDCRSLWGKREHKVTLKTKCHAEALRRAARVNTDFDNKIMRLRAIISGDSTNHDDLRQEAKDILLAEGIHPEQRPNNKKESEAYFERREDWSNLYLDTVDTQNGYNPDGTIWTTYHEDVKSPYYHAHEILQNRQSSAIIPTVAEATETYLKVNAEKAKRTAYNQQKHEQRVRRAASQLGIIDIPVTDITRLKARRFKESLREQNPTWSDNTLERAITILSAIYATAIQEYELTISNPWLGMAGSAKNKDSSTSEDRANERRSFTPRELTGYVGALEKLNDEARLVGMIMLKTGCRTMEAGGLLVKDLRLEASTPHIQIRVNRFRRLKTENSVRNIPLTEGMIAMLSAYVTTLNSDDDEDPLFPKYGRDGGTDALSSQLRKAIRKHLNISDRRLVPYSTRHTMKDKLRALQTPEDIQHRILGHGTRTQADGYGDGTPLVHLLDVLSKAERLENWGL